MKTITCLFLLLGLTYETFGQAPSYQWRKVIGGNASDFLTDVVQTTDNGFIAVGASSTSNNGDVALNRGGMDYWIVKTDVNGIVQWKKSYGGSQDDYAFCVKQTSDGGYYVGGHTFSTDGDVIGNHGANDAFILKLNAQGNIVWKKTIGGSDWDAVRSIEVTADGGCIFTGESFSHDGDVNQNKGYDDYWVVKLNSTGNILWSKTYGGSSGETPWSIINTTDGGYILTGYSRSNNGDASGNHGVEDLWILKLNSTGNILWQNSYGGSGVEKGYDISQTTDGGYIVSGTASSNDGQVTGNQGLDDFWVIRLNSTGTLQWQKCLGGSGFDAAWGVKQLTDGTFLVGGETGSNNGQVLGNHGGDDFWLVRLSETGNLMYQKTMGGQATDEGRCLTLCNDGGAVMIGTTWGAGGDVATNYGNVDAWFIKLTNILTQGCSDNYEPNNVLTDAKIIPLNSDISGKIVSSIDKDYLKFTLSTISNVNITLTNLPANYDIKITNLANTQLGISQNSGLNDESISLTNLAAGTYVVQVYGQSGAYHVNNCYTLKINTALGSSCANNYEPNESLSAAKSILLNTNIYGQIATATDQDYLKFSITTSSNVSISLTTLLEDYNVNVYNSAGTIIGTGSNSGTTSENIVLNNLSIGTYTAHIYRVGGFSTNFCYTLRINSVSICSNTNEPNESLSAAKTIPLNTNVAGQIASSSDKDYLKFSLLSLSDVTITLSTLPANYDLKLYNSAGTQIGLSTKLGTLSESIILTNLNPGTYTIYIYGYGGAFSSNSCYTLNINDTPISMALKMETDENTSTGVETPNLYALEEGEVVLFPNPAKDQVTINIINGDHQLESVRLNIIDPVMGRIIKTENLNLLEGENVKVFDISDLARGLYFIMLEGDGFSKTQRLILE